MEPQPPTFKQRLFSFLKYLEIIALVLIAVGFALLHLYHSGPGPQFIMIGFTAFAAVNFMYAYLPEPPTEADANKNLLLIRTIVRKVLFLGSSVCLIGILFSILDLNGAREMLLIGSTAAIVTILAAGALIIKDDVQLDYFKGGLLRGVPIAIYSMHWLYEFGLFSA
jgi:hypothetical protein